MTKTNDILIRNVCSDFKEGVFDIDILGNKYHLGTAKIRHILSIGGIHKGTITQYIIKDEVIAMRSKGMSLRAITAKCNENHDFRITKYAVNKCINDFEIAKFHSKDSVLEMYSNGMKQIEIARALGVSKQFVSYKLKGYKHEKSI